MKGRSQRGHIDIIAGALAASILASACARNAAEERGQVQSKGESLADKPLATEIAWLGDLHQPESVKYDADQDVFFISNMVGFGSDKDSTATS
jgi:hypothetical protein